MCDMTYIVRLTGYSAETRRSLARYYAGLPDDGRIEAHLLQSGLVRLHGEQKEPGLMPAFLSAMLLLALNRIHDAEFQTQSHRKGAVEETADAKRIREIRILDKRKMGRRPAGAKKIVDEHYRLISQLRKRETSWREVSRHLVLRYRKKISYMTLQKYFEQITAERKEEKSGRFTPAASARLAGYFAGLSDADQVEAFRLQLDLIRRNRSEFSGRGQGKGKKTDRQRAEFFYTMFLLSLHALCNAESGRSAENPAEIPPDLPAGPQKKSAPKKEKLDKKLYDLAGQLRNDGWSWRKIARNLAQHNRIRIGHVWLKECFERITVERKARGEK